MSKDDKPGPLPERDAFEHWFSNGGKYHPAVQRSGEGYALAAAQAAWNAWKAGVAAERERCAALCEAHAGMRGTGAWTVLTAAAARIRDPERAKRDAAPDSGD